MIPLAAIQLGLSAVKGIQGAAQVIGGNRRLKRLFNQRSVYSTPDEVYDSLNLATNNAQTGFGAETMNYLTTQSDRDLTSSLGAATRLGADPNAIANIFDNQMQNVLKIGAENETMRLSKLGQVYQGLQGVIQGKDAEYASKQNLIKDQMAAEAQKVQAGQQNIESGINGAIGALSYDAQSKLFEQANGIGRYAANNTEMSLPSIPKINANDSIGSATMNTSLSNQFPYEFDSATIKKMANFFKQYNNRGI
jgi:hypothetical protein